MISLEAFSLGKRFGHPELNEDAMVMVPGVGYAVIDGVTDRNGTRYGGMLAGQFASRAAARAINRLFLEGVPFPGAAGVVERVTQAIAQGYRDAGVYEQAQNDNALRAGCAIVVCMANGERLETISVGDSGIRINGGQIAQGLKPLDDVTSRLRREAWRYFASKGYSEAECERLSSSVTWQGTRNQPADLPTAAPDARDAIERAAFAVNREALPQVPDDEILQLVHNGIAGGQGGFMNATEKALGYSVVDGFPVPARFIETYSHALQDVETIELFSDGYFSPAPGFGVAAWEAEFERVEKEDPHKIGRYMSTKGTTAVSLTDDRTYLGVRLE